MKGPVFSVPVGEMKPQGVYDIPPTKGVSELLYSEHVYVGVYWDKTGRADQRGKTSLCERVKGREGKREGGKKGNN